MVQMYLKNKDTGDGYIGTCPCGCGTMLDSVAVFDDPNEAKEYAKEHSIGKEYKLAVYVDDSWKKREAQRIIDGVYTLPVWNGTLPFSNSDDGRYPHVSEEDNSYLAYTASPEKGMQDVQTKIRPGKYLKQFHGDVLDEAAIKYWSSKHTEQFASHNQLQWARTPDEMENVYTMQAGFTSCMQHPPTKFVDQHPVRIYGAGDLAIAYMTKGNTLIARALVWPDKKKVGRIYGDESKLRNALKRAGIETQSTNRSFDSFDGARVLRMDIKREGQIGFIMPYIDGNLYALPEDDKFIRLIRSPNDRQSLKIVDVHTTIGCSLYRYKCAECGCGTQMANEVITLNGRELICPDCRDKYMYATIERRYFDSRIPHYTYYEVSDIELNRPQYTLEQKRIFISDYDHQPYNIIDAVMVEDEKWNCYQAVNYAKDGYFSQLYFKTKNMVKVVTSQSKVVMEGLPYLRMNTNRFTERDGKWYQMDDLFTGENHDDWWAVVS